MGFQIVTVALLAILAGAAVLAVIQLRRTLRIVEAFVETTGPKLGSALDEAAGAAAKFRAAADRVKSCSAALGRFVDAGRELVDAGRELVDLLGMARDAIRSRRSARHEMTEGGRDS